MIRFAIKLALFLVVGILIYNYFFGDSSEKAQSEKIFGEVRGVVGSMATLLKSEKQKFDAGKYDQALDKLGDAYQALRKQAKYLDENVLKEVNKLEKRKSTLQKELDSINEMDQQMKAASNSGKKASKETQAQIADQQRRKEELQQELDQLLKDTDALMKEAQQ